ncbi:hypothetical protein CJ179_38935 [Rhodococcus sp. ACS1]|uniref:hypothetical protein n=1 Tax=Rhodococcus sp. ACS1 TaxID=2028570 RepID=UPI000BB0E8E3|nr:hypothetical protein [Rhodococcus sp. ACS1]PBC38573.1 hypothetical protein CJ179_38935 [Rhodococcus sp. ACS1]
MTDAYAAQLGLYQIMPTTFVTYRDEDNNVVGWDLIDDERRQAEIEAEAELEFRQQLRDDLNRGRFRTIGTSL